MKTDKPSYYIVNGITMYRLTAAPFLLLLAVLGHLTLFKWLAAISFLTDAIDGPLARKYKVESVFGSRLDSVADDATVLVSTIGLWIIYPDFVSQHAFIIIGLLALFCIQTIGAVIAYGKVTSFHTYLAKLAFMLIFFDLPLAINAFYFACLITALELIEEIILVLVLQEWKANVKGLYWILRTKKLITH
jgi:phosphatidylglycerophosphate synthase